MGFDKYGDSLPVGPAYKAFKYTPTGQLQTVAFMEFAANTTGASVTTTRRVISEPVAKPAAAGRR